MRFFRIIPFILFILFALVSCGKDSATETPGSTARLLTSSTGYTLRVERGSGKIEVTAPEELRGVVFSFTDGESYLESGDVKIPLSENAAAPYRDYLVMAYPEDHGGETAFEQNGAQFTAEYRDGSAVSATVSRGGVERSVTLTEE